jgi:GH35 family endo-1,4-beta-xylanase
VNEATVSQRFDNAVGRWIARNGAAECVARALGWAHEANPKATLLYNDFNVSPDFEALVQGLIDRRAPVHTLGIQSHMHKGTWTLAKTWETCEAYARFGLPLHFTELTVVSGRFKDKDDNDWHKVRTDWPTTPDGEARQADYAEQFYTLLFSHPAVEAITWWDFSDNGSWQGAPSGLVRSDMTAKPLYDRLMEMSHKRWITDAEVTTDASGCASVHGFFGEHELEGTSASGEKIRARFTLSRLGRREIPITVE